MRGGDSFDTVPGRKSLSSSGRQFLVPPSRHGSGNRKRTNERNIRYHYLSSYYVWRAIMQCAIQAKRFGPGHGAKKRYCGRVALTDMDVCERHDERVYSASKSKSKKQPAPSLRSELV